MVKNYKIIDILHTGHHGPKGKSKVGSKYEFRKGQIMSIDLDYYRPGETLVFTQNNRAILCTTPFVKYYKENDKVAIETINSIYITEEINETINDNMSQMDT